MSLSETSRWLTKHLSETTTAHTSDPQKERSRNRKGENETFNNYVCPILFTFYNQIPHDCYDKARTHMTAETNPKQSRRFPIDCLTPKQIRNNARNAKWKMKREKTNKQRENSI